MNSKTAVGVFFAFMASSVFADTVQINISSAPYNEGNAVIAQDGADRAVHRRDKVRSDRDHKWVAQHGSDRLPPGRV